MRAETPIKNRSNKMGLFTSVCLHVGAYIKNIGSRSQINHFTVIRLQFHSST